MFNLIELAKKDPAAKEGIDKWIAEYTEAFSTSAIVEIVVDSSASMSSLRQATVSSVKEYISTLNASDSVRIRDFNRTLFEGRADKFVGIEASYDCAGMTPLYDAIGQSAVGLAERKTDKKILVVITDGHENASTRYNKESLKKLIDTLESQDALVIFLGANIDSFGEGEKIGTKMDYTMNFAATPRGLSEALFSVGAATTRYRSGGKSKAGFTQQEREASI